MSKPRSLFSVFLVVLTHWKRKPLQLFLIFVGLTTATALWSTVKLINESAERSFNAAQQLLNQTSAESIQSINGNYFPDDSFVELRKQGWEVTPILRGSPPYEPLLTIIGVDLISSMTSSSSQRLMKTVDFERFMADSKPLLANQRTYEKFSQNTVLDTFIILSDLPDGYIICDIGKAQELLGLEGRLSSMEFVGPIPNDMTELLALGLYFTETNQKNEIQNLSRSFHLNLEAFGFLSFVVGLFIYYSIITMAYEQRKSALRNLRVLGISAITLSSLMILEIALFALLSGNLGMFVSFIIASYLLPDVSVALASLFDQDMTHIISFSPSFWILSLFVSLLGAITASSTVLWRASKLSPLETGKKIAWVQKANYTLKGQAFLCVLFSLVACILMLYGDGLLAAFILLGLIILASTLALPTVLWTAVNFILSFKIDNPIFQWFIADTKQQINGLSACLMSLLIALSVNIGVNGMIESFRQTFLGWLDQRLVSELYLSVKDPALASQIELYLDEKVESVLPIVKVPARTKNILIDIFGFSPDLTYEENWPLLQAEDMAWEKITRGEGVLINEQLSRRLQAGLSDNISVISNGRYLTFKVLAIYSDYGNSKGQIMIPISVFDEKFPEIPHLQFALRTYSSNNEELRRDLIQKFDINSTSITDQQSLKDFSTQIFEKTFSVTRALAVLTLAVAGVSLFTSVTSLSAQRISQIAPVWAIGINRKALAKLEFLRIFTFTFITFIFSVPIGLVIAWILMNYVHLEAFDWRIPAKYFPVQWLELFLVNLAVTFVSVFLYYFSIRRASPSDLLRVTSYET
ncbi:MAG: FtsX-like permease family protein [Pseudomonadota bacterium]|nr:FtsX-like permease family protein [Pseudomonadota bacterium]